jgi:glycosyltransferase involved in cell wall biosynthesis
VEPARIAVVYVLAKNESVNIDGCLASLRECGLRAVVLDSGSTDTTHDQVRAFDNAELRPWVYTNHCDAYNQITMQHRPDEWVMVLDADMRVSPALKTEIESMLDSASGPQAVKAPVRMFWDGLPLHHCSLYPPKPVVFRGGAAYFEPAGHGERLKQGLRVAMTRARLDHDDRKPFQNVLANQWRYAIDVVKRSDAGHATWRDKLRRRTPLMMLITPLYAYIVRRGFLDGRAGVIYAIDRLIAETLAYRASMSPLVKQQIEQQRAAGKATSK